MRHPTWFYVVLAGCAITFAGAAGIVAASTTRYLRWHPLGNGAVVDTQRGVFCTWNECVEIDPAPTPYPR
jgi:hypothetical protein